MVYLNKIKNYMLYRTPVNFNPKVSLTGSVICIADIADEDYSNIINLLNSNKLFKKDKMFSYYSSKKILMKSLAYNKTEVKAPHNKMIKDNTKIKFIYETFANYKNKNLFYDISKEMSIIQDSKKSFIMKLTQYRYFLMEKFYEDCKDYSNKTIIFTLNSNFPINTMTLIKNKLRMTHSLQMFVNLLKNKEDFVQELIDKEYKVLIFDKDYKFFMKIDFGSFKVGKDSFEWSKFMVKLNSLISINNKGENETVNVDKSLIDSSYDEEDIDEDVPEENLPVEEEDNSSEEDTTISSEEKEAIKAIKSAEKEDRSEDQIKKDIKERIKEIQRSGEDENDIKERLENDAELSKLMGELQANEQVGPSKQRLKRIEVLKREQDKVKVDGRTVGQILKDFKHRQIENNEIKQVENLVSNKSLHHCVLKDFDESYVNKQDMEDKVAIVNSFSNDNHSIPMYVRSFKIEDTSDSMSKKNTLHIAMEDSIGVRHTITVDVPKVVEGKFLVLNNTRKTLGKQLVPLPVTKTSPDAVQIVSNYNKVFIRRYGTKISPIIEQFKKILPTIKDKNFKLECGDNGIVNRDYITSLDYGDLSNTFTKLRVTNLDGNETVIEFNQKTMEDIMNEGKIISKPNLPDEYHIVIGYTNVLEKSGNFRPLIYDTKEDNVDKTNISLTGYILNLIEQNVDSEIRAKLKTASLPKKFVYTRASVLSRQLPLVLLLAYKEGLSNLLLKAKIKHKIESNDHRPVYNPEYQGIIKFSDMVLIYDIYPFENALLLNGLSELPTENFNFEDFNSKDVYISIFEILYGSRVIAKGYDNFCELFIDPITKDVLEDYNMPTEFTELYLFANKMLVDNACNRENDMANYRIRSMEMLNVELYKVLSEAYSTYKNSNGSIKMSVPRDAVMKRLNLNPLIVNYDATNPIAEMEAQGVVSWKGPSGLNLDESFNLKKRSYDQSMMGTISIVTGVGAGSGITKAMSYNSSIHTTRGYIKVPEVKDLKFPDMMCWTELTSPFFTNHDDAQRSAMTYAQASAIIPVEKSNRLLIGTGAERTIPYMTSKDFIFTAKDDGKIVDYDEDCKTMIVQYKNGTSDIIDLNSSIVNNGGKLNHCLVILLTAGKT